MRKLCLLVLCLVFSCALGFAKSSWTPSLEIQAGCYEALPLAAYLDKSVPMRTQGIAKICLDLLGFRVGRFQAGGAFSLLCATPSLTANHTRLKSFWGYGARFLLGGVINPCWTCGLGAEFDICDYGTDVKFASAGGLLYNQFTLALYPSYGIFLTAPFEITYRKDIVAASLSLGLKFMFMIGRNGAKK